jgi:hypothetical protein
MTRRVLLLCVALSGCQKIGEALTPQPKTLKSADGTLELTVPGSWNKDTELHKQAAIQASNRMGELYVIVLSETKEDLADMDLAKFSELTRGSQLKAMKNAAEEGPVNRTINGMKAIEYVLKGSVENANIMMKHIAVDGPKHYHQVIVWTLKSKWETEKATLDAVVDSLKETSAGGPRAPAPAP